LAEASFFFAMFFSPSLNLASLGSGLVCAIETPKWRPATRQGLKVTVSTSPARGKSAHALSFFYLPLNLSMPLAVTPALEWPQTALGVAPESPAEKRGASGTLSVTLAAESVELLDCTADDDRYSAIFPVRR
jgi:hypothetical protein